MRCICAFYHSVMIDQGSDSLSDKIHVDHHKVLKCKTKELKMQMSLKKRLDTINQIYIFLQCFNRKKMINIKVYNSLPLNDVK